MALEALSSNELLNFINYDSICPNPYSCNVNDTSDTSFMPETCPNPQECRGGGGGSGRNSSMKHCSPGDAKSRQNPAVHGRKKRRRRAKACKNKEEAETQRMTHIAVERNRRKQMNNHLTVLRSLMPEPYVQRGDQASIVGGAIEYVKELEYLLQSLEAQKLQLLQQGRRPPTDTTAAAAEFTTAPFAQFFAYPEYTLSRFPHKYTFKSQAAVADIEVTLIETHANLRILSQKSIRQLSKMVAGFQTLCLTILHLNVTSLDSLVLYSISTKVEEGCQLTSADEIACAVHHMLRIIEEDATLC